MLRPSFIMDGRPIHAAVTRRGSPEEEEFDRWFWREQGDEGRFEAVCAIVDHMEDAELEITDFRGLFRHLNEEAVEYLLVGAHAVIFCSEPRYSQDMGARVRPFDEARLEEG